MNVNIMENGGVVETKSISDDGKYNTNHNTLKGKIYVSEFFTYNDNKTKIGGPYASMTLPITFKRRSEKKSNKKFLGIHNSIQAASKEIVESYLEETSRTGPKVLMFEPLSMPTKTRSIMFPGEDKKNLSTCEVEANKLVKILISEITN